MNLRLLTGILAVAFTLALVPAAQADYDSSLTGSTITLTGNGDPDTLVISQDGGLLEHNRAGDPGFNSEIDWNNSVGGDQFLAAFAPNLLINVNAGAGVDRLTVGQAGPQSSARFVLGTVRFNGGAGTDFAGLSLAGETEARSLTLTGTSLSLPVGEGARLEWDDTENLLGTLGSGNDSVALNGSPVGIVTEFFGNDGNDTVTASGLAFLAGPVKAVGGPGADTLTVNESAGTPASSYTVGDSFVGRGGAGEILFDNTLENVALNTGDNADRVSKSGSRAVSIDSNGGDDEVITRDAVADSVSCGEGSDFVLTDPLDNLLSDCETSDRTLATPPPSNNNGGGGGGGTPQPPAPGPAAADTKAPAITLTGVPKKLKLRSLLKGVTVKVATDEPSVLGVKALGSTSKATLARSFNLTLAQATRPLAGGSRSVKLKPSKKLVGKARRFSVQVEVVATDAAGNRSTKRATIKVTR
jgi:hypothetical protein